MAPARKSRNVNKRYSYANEGSPSKDGDSAKRTNSRKRKLSDLLGPRWTMEELTRFYDAYRKYGQDWKKVMGAVRNRSLEMVEALYTMNRAYLSLPHGTASAAGLIAMMTDHYSNLGGSDSDQESNDGAGSARKSQKRARGKAQPTTYKALDEQLVSNSQTFDANYGCMSLLKKKRSGGSRPRPVGKRTPRFPVAFSYENTQGEKYFSPTRQGLNIKANANDDDVAHEVAITLAEVSQRGGSPQVSRTPSKRDGSAISSPFGHAERKHSVAEANARLLGAGMDEEDLEGSTEADTAELSRYKLDKMESVTAGMSTQKGRKVDKKKFEDDDNYLDDIKEECSGTGEGRRLSEMRGKFDIEVAGANTSKSSMQGHRNKSKKVLFGEDEDPAFDALQTLAAMSLMMPVDNEDESRVEFKDEDDDHVDESMSLEAPRANQHKTTRKSLGLRMKGHQTISSMEVASSKPSKHGKGSAIDVSSAPEEIQPSHLDAKRSRKKQKMPTKKPEGHSDIHLSESLGVEVGGEGKKIVTKSRKSSQNSFSKLIKISENSSSADLRKEGSDSTHSAVDVSVVNPVNLPTKGRSRRKMDLKQPEIQKDLRFPDKISSDQINVPFASLSDRALSFKEKLSNCLSNEGLRRWCTYEWFYSAIDYPWFAKREFVEYLDHVGLGHVPTLTRVEWGVIRSSLGKPRRFSEQFLKEEKEKLNQYRDSVRKHYTELREGVREGLPTDLARPLSVGQRVIAIHPKTREIHDGSVLTVDHSRCRVQFDRPELGVEFVMDIDCMPSNPFENIPALHEKSTVSLDKFFENFNESKANGLAKEYMKLSPGDNLDSIDGISQLSPLANPANLLKQTKVASTNVNGQTRIGPVDSATYQSAAYSQHGALAHIQAKEADVQALSELNRALDKKEAIVLELRQMNDDVFENQKEGDGSLKDSEPFKMQYAGVLIKLNEANDQVSSALHCLRDRNTYQGNNALMFARSVTSLADHGDRSACQTQESGSNVNEIMDSSRSKAQTMVDAAVQAISTLKGREDSFDKIEEAIDYVNDRLPSDDSFTPMAPDFKSMNAPGVETQIPSDMITKCVATLLMIQRCTERQFPPSDVAQILDSAVTSLQPRSSQNLPVYNEIQKCMGIIRNQILALIPT